MIDAPTPHAASGEVIASGDPISAILPFAGRPLTVWRDLPWSVVRDGKDRLLLRLDRTREEALGDRANREVVMACGAVLENLRIAAHHHRAELVVEPWPYGQEHSVVARLSLGQALSPRREEEALYSVLSSAPQAAGTRIGGGVSPALIAVLRHAARSEGGWLDVVSDDARRQIVGDLESEAAAIADAERGARRLLTARLGASGGGSVGGGAQFAMGGGASLGELLGALGANVQPSNEWSSGRAAAARGSALEAPVLAVLGASEDSPDAWLKAGAALQRVLLHASVQGLTAVFLNEPLHHPLLRDALRSVLFAAGAPQAILRFDFDANGAVVDLRSHRFGSVSAA
ncbi:MAG: hypothetical protein IT359_07245 [Gemmatimonadaceae bacterium]|nr:hypothetical protein [Gemmatimonadaceae bacterium]